ncbi:hypothetical protein MANY_04390 [Mycolicibacterium anyangense]|uniref:Chaplin domain-containing protein n=1 Tax=Mycolicibacterium anyangense TaxID=1431246 RepID=A0A6N4W4W2_9MYCO|nr:hypothetical protein [Mycolicibacterium anyangense]BBZ75102.1 hypothetical protein MANY_04390 [Mycolicibacterium anyangense]
MTSLAAALGGLAACSLILAGPAAAAGHVGPGNPGPGAGTHIGAELPIAPVGAAGVGEAAKSAATHLSAQTNTSNDHTIGLELPIAPVG